MSELPAEIELCIVDIETGHDCVANFANLRTTISRALDALTKERDELRKWLTQAQNVVGDQAESLNELRMEVVEREHELTEACSELTRAYESRDAAFWSRDEALKEITKAVEATEAMRVERDAAAVTAEANENVVRNILKSSAFVAGRRRGLQQAADMLESWYESGALTAQMHDIDDVAMIRAEAAKVGAE